MSKKSNELITVIMGVYNGEKYLRSSVDSILNQSYKNLEFIVVDDGSTDGSLGILESYKDSRLIIIKNEHNIGLTKSLNKALQIARGEFIARQDADDISDPDRLSKQLELLISNSDIGMVGCQAVVINEESGYVDDINLPLNINESVLLESNQFIHGAALMRYSVLNEIGCYRDFFRYAQDYDLWLRIVQRYGLLNSPERLYSLRRVSTSLTLQRFDQQLIFAMLAKGFFHERSHKGADSYHLLNDTNPNKLLKEQFPRLFAAKPEEKYKSSLYLAEQSRKAKNYTQVLYWLKSAFLVKPRKIIDIFKVLLKNA